MQRRGLSVSVPPAGGVVRGSEEGRPDGWRYIPKGEEVPVRSGGGGWEHDGCREKHIESEDCRPRLQFSYLRERWREFF